MDHATIESLYRSHGDFVLRCARRILQNEQAALDARQEIFLRALDALKSFRGEASPTTWLYRITTNYCLNELRNRSRREELLREGAPRTDRVEVPWADRHTVLRVLECVPEDVARIAVHYFVNEMSQEEIAAFLNVSRRHVRERLATFRGVARCVIDEVSETYT